MLRTVAFAGLGIVGLLAQSVLSGCEVDSFMDPSVIGRWEKTPTVMPILDRLSVIEDEPSEFVQVSNIVPSDLVPEADQYRLAVGDSIEIRIRDFFTLGLDEAFSRAIDQRGYIDLPRLPQLRAQGRTAQELTTAIENAVRERQINDRPVVTVTAVSQRKQTFSVMGAVSTPGQFFIPAPDYRLLDALTTSGSFSETIPFIYVIRQVPLTDAAAGQMYEPEPVRRKTAGQAPTNVRSSTTPSGQDQPTGEDLLHLIEDLSAQPGGNGSSDPKPVNENPKPASPSGSPAMLSLQDSGMNPGMPNTTRTMAAQPPAIDLPDANVPSKLQGAGNAAPGSGGWVYVDGKWMKTAQNAEGGAAGGAGSEQNVVTQRVIKVPTGPLLAGAADVNLVIRPGDVIRIPPSKSGQVYMGGQVARPGAYNLPFDGRLTLLRAFDSAGGLTGIAIPERVDLMRMVGGDRQATIRLDVKAIAEQTQPDIYLKPDDRINVGTNFWATPLAVFRGGLRASYGFGFILDRNFEGEVFGNRANNSF